MSMPAPLPELTQDGLALWRLRWGADSQLWCEVGDFAGELLLRFYDPGTDETTLAEVCESIEAAVGQADALRDQFVAAGWEVVDADLDESD